MIVTVNFGGLILQALLESWPRTSVAAGTGEGGGMRRVGRGEMRERRVGGVR